ncbi:MAG: hypothetical protein WA989_07335 [Henriciella sp.]|uniref:hypothetical protein n=1 Tax=Henriciella sp. TaxID=1968823 RepID=UPI003C7961D3
MPLEFLYGVGAVILLGVLIWAVAVPRLKSSKARTISEEATRMQYEHPETYKRHQDELEAMAEQAEEEERARQS